MNADVGSSEEISRPSITIFPAESQDVVRVPPCELLDANVKISPLDGSTNTRVSFAVVA